MDTVLVIGNGRFQVGRSHVLSNPGDTSSKVEVIYGLDDIEAKNSISVNEIQANLLAYYDDTKARKCYLIAAEGYVVVDYRKKKIEEQEELANFPKEVQEIFSQKELFTAFPQKTIPNRENENNVSIEVNTPQNTVITALSTGGGYIAEHNGTYYFANPDDRYKLYQMDSNFENKVKLSDHPNFSRWIEIQLYENKLYYLQNEKSISWWPLSETIWTLYAYDLVEDTETKVLDENIYSYTIHEGWIFFSSMDAEGICKAKTDGADLQIDRKESADPYVPINVQVCKNQLFYGMGEGLYWMQLDGSDFHGEPSYPYALLAYDQNVYYINMYTKALHKSSFSEEDDYPINAALVGEKINAFTILGDNIYYETTEKKIYKTDLNGNNPEFVAKGAYPIATGEYLFYYSIGKMRSLPLG